VLSSAASTLSRDHPRRFLMNESPAIFIVLALEEDEEEAKR
jgi:hypothetical protein